MNTILDREDFVFKPPELGCVLSLSELPGGSGKVYDRSPYGNIGAITGASWVRLPSGLWCLDFDGTDDKVTVSNATSLQPGSRDFTIIVWVKVENFTDGLTAMGLINKGGTTQGFDFRFGDKGDGTEFQIQLHDGTTRDTPKITFDSALASDTWYLLAMPIDRSANTGWMYVNGVVDSSTFTFTIGTNSIAGSNDIWIGVDYDTKYFEGIIALPKIIMGRALTAFDIQNIFEQEKHLFGVW